MINSVMRIDCSECSSTGLIFFGNGNDFDVESCGCDFGKDQDLFFN